MLRNRHSNSSVSSDANWSYGYQDHSLNQKNACNSFRYSNCLCLCLPSARPSNPSLLRPSALPSNPPSTPLSSFPTFPPSLYFSIHSFDFPLFRRTVCRPVLPTLLPCSRWLPSCSWPSLPSAVRRSVLLYGWFIIRLVGFTYLRYKERKYDSALHGHDLTEPIQCVLRQRRVILKHVHRAPLE